MDPHYSREDLCYMIITNTREHFENNRRAIDETCMYITPSGEKCAVGRYLREPEKAKGGTVAHIWKDSYELDDALLPAYRGLPFSFWEELQTFHDCSVFWDKEGKLTSEGEEYYDFLLEQWGGEK